MLDKSSITNLKGPIFVIGGTGFIGANLVREIKQVRDDVYAIVRENVDYRLADINPANIVRMDINDVAAMKQVINEYGPKTVFNCSSYGAYSFETDDSLIYKTNFDATVNLVKLLQKQNIAAYVHAGSSSEYGQNCSAPLESDECLPDSAYAVSKLATSNFLRFVGKQHSFPCVNLRLYSVYGRYEDTSRLRPNMLRQAKQGGYPALVNGDISRDFVHIRDVCNAFILAATNMNSEISGENFNIGTGVKTTIKDLADTVKRMFDIAEDPEFDTMDQRKWDQADWFANPEKAEQRLGWRAAISLEEGLLETGEWIETIDDMHDLQTSKKDRIADRRSISAIIACYKDGQAIPYMHERLTAVFKKLGVDYEIIFVNDGSPDDCRERILELSKDDPHVLGINHSRNFGSQMAFRSGMELSSKDSVVLLDGDLQDPPELIEEFYEQWLNGYDVVYGRRVKRMMPFIWGLLYKLFYRIFAWVSYVKIPHDAGDFSLMDRKVVESLRKFGERDLFLRGLRAYVGFKQVGVDYVRPERMFGVTTNSMFKNLEWAKMGIFSFSNVPITVLTYLGTVLFAISLVLIIGLAVLKLLVPDIAPQGLTTVLIVSVFFGSINIFALGLVGEYVAKILIEVKQRPGFIRASIIRNGQDIPN